MASATATANGASGLAQTRAVTKASGIVTSVDAKAQAQVGSVASAFSQVDADFVFGFNAANNNSYSFATVLPNAGTVGALLTANSNVNAVLGTGNASARVFGAGNQGAFYSTTATGARTYQSSVAYTIDSRLFSGNLVAGMLDTQLLGTGFQTLAFSVQVGAATVVNQSFTTTAAANAFFDNRVLDLGAVSPRCQPGCVVQLHPDHQRQWRGLRPKLPAWNHQRQYPPVNAVPGDQKGLATVTRAVTGISISDPDATVGELFTTTVSVAAGVLTTTVLTGVTGSGTSSLKIVGTVAEVNSALATLAIKENAAGTDTITIVTKDAKGGVGHRHNFRDHHGTSRIGDLVGDQECGGRQ